MLLWLVLFSCNDKMDIDDSLIEAPPEEAVAAVGGGGSEMDAGSGGGGRAPLWSPPPPVEMPSGAAIFRRSCFGGEDDDRPSMPIPSGSASGMGPTGGTSRTTPSKAPTTAKPSSAPTSTTSVAPPPMAAEPSMSYDMGAAEEAVAAAPVLSPSATPPAGPALSKNESAPRDAELPPVQPQKGPTLDWGATVYLSNDDSMSLASAQRVLWAADRGAPIKASQVRPHELLNYFSFDTTPVDPADMFSVLGSAEVTKEGTLTVALAVKGANPPRIPLDLTVVIDRSGSMWDEGRMEYVKKGLTTMKGSLQKGDRVNVVLFDDRVCTPLEDYVVGRDDPSLLDETIRLTQPRGSTDLGIGLAEGYRLATARPATIHRNARVMVITDAWLNTGDVSESSVTQIGKAFDSHGVRMTGIGVGREFNDKVLDMLTEKGKGAYVYLGSEAVVERVFGIGFDSLTRTIAHDVQFAIDLPDSLAMEKFYGEEASTTKEDVQPINYYAGTSQLFLQDLKMKGSAPSRSDTVTFLITYREAATGEPAEQRWQTTVGGLLDGDPHNLRKGRALMAWTEMLTAQAMFGSGCGAPFTAYQDAQSRVVGDAEIGYVNGLVGKMCGVTIPVAASLVAYKVKIDSDIPIAEVGLACEGWTAKETLSGSDTVANFKAPSGTCRLTLLGNVAMETQVDVPKEGADIRCQVRGGRMSCM